MKLAFHILLIACSLNYSAMAVEATGITEIYIAKNGSDTNSGTKEAPLSTLAAARDLVRKLKAQSHPTGEMTLWIGGGIYALNDTLELDARDSGSAAAPVTFRALPGAEVRLSGGIALDPKSFVPVTDPAILRRLPSESRTHVLQMNLGTAGAADLGTMRPIGFPYPVEPVPPELFFNDQRMQLARWPNDGFTTSGAVIDKGSVPRDRDPLLPKAEQNFEPNRPPTFVYQGEHLARWAADDDVWLFGYWTYRWAEETLRVSKIDLAKHQITLATPAFYGVSPNVPFYALNVLEELDSPGEYYIDRHTRILYFWPPSDVSTGHVVLSRLARPMIAMTNASHVTFRDLVFENARGCGIYIAGGSGNRIDHCILRNLGTIGIMIGEGAKGEDIGDIGWSNLSRLYQQSAWNRNAGTDQGVIACIVHDTGADGIILGGGDRKSLTPGSNFVSGCEIYRVGRWFEQNHPAVGIDGVGNRMSNNFLHDMSHAAVMFRGNDHLIERNELARCVTRSSDAGAIYTGRDCSGRGNIIRYNYIHNCGPAKLQPGDLGTSAVYFDDSTSGQFVTGNIFYRAATPGVIKGTIWFNGGYDNAVEDNFFIDCPPKYSGGAMNNKDWNAFVRTEIQMQRLRQAVDITAPPYSTHYPQLASVYNDSPNVQRVNVDRNNHVIGDPTMTQPLEKKKLVEFPSDLEAQFKAAEIPFAQIGLLESAGPFGSR